LTLTISTTGSALNPESAETESAGPVVFSPVGSVSLGQSLFRQGGHDEGAGADGEKAGESADASTSPALSGTTPWERFFLKLDDALERFRREFQDGLLGTQDQATETEQPNAKPSADASPPSGPTSLRSTPGPLPNRTGQNPIQGRRPTDRDEAIDASIHSIWGEDVYPVSVPLIIAGMMAGSTGVARPNRARLRFVRDPWERSR
jgi:hypothetical protein